MVNLQRRAATSLIQLDFVTLPSPPLLPYLCLSPIRHLETICTLHVVCLRVCVCVCQNADCRVFSRGWGGAEKLDAGKRTTERESFLFLVVPR